MAKDDNSVIFLKDWKMLIQSLSLENQLYFWDLFTSYEYQSEQECDNDYVKPIWNFVKSQLDNMKEKYINKTVKTNQINGAKGGRPPKTQPNPNNPMGFSETQITPKDKDNNNEKDKVNDIIEPTAKQKTFKQLSEEEFKYSLIEFVEKFGKKTVRSFFEYWSEKDAKGKMRFQLEKTWDSKKRLTTWKGNESKFGNSEPEKPKPQNSAVTYSGPFHN